MYADSNPARWVDPFGLYKLLNCEPSQAKVIDDAVKRAKKASKKCLSCADQRFFEDELEDATIVCSKQSYSQWSPGTPVCGRTLDSPRGLAITPAGFNSPKGCGTVAQSVFHEALHLIGYERDWEDWIRELEQKCVQ